MDSKEISRIISLVESAYKGEPWYGQPAKEILAGIDSNTAFDRPVPGAHNIYELVKHMIAWRKFVWKRLGGENNFFLTDEENWEKKEVNNNDTWSSALTELEESQNKLVNILKSTPEEKLYEKVSGKAYNYYTLLHGIIHHDIYHLGQISLLKKGKK